MAPYIDQSHKELNLACFDAPLPPESLNIVASTPMQETGNFIGLQAHVIGASHAVSIQHEGGTFVEVFACLPYGHCEPHPRHYHRSIFKDTARFTDEFNTKCYKYTFFAEANEITPSLFSPASQFSDILKSGEPWCVHHNFGKGDFHDAVTAVKLAVLHDHQVVIYTFHVYPNEDIVVRTRSTFTLNNH